MHQLELNPRQVATVTALAGASVADHSPLPRVPVPEALDAADPDFADLVDQHALQPHEGSWRLNVLGGAVLFTCAQPAEVLALRPADPSVPSLFACRRGTLWVECEVEPEGAVRLVFPFTRDFMITTALAGLGGDRPEPTPSGFRFEGSPDGAFALASLAPHLADGGSASAGDIERIVVAATIDLPRVAAFTALVGPEPIDRLARDRAARHQVLRGLVAAGHLDADGTQVRLSDPARLALGSAAAAGVSAERWSLADGTLGRTAVQASRCGDRLLAFQVLERGSGPTVQWAEVTRAELRSLVTATFLPPDRLAPPDARNASTTSSR